MSRTWLSVLYYFLAATIPLFSSSFASAADNSWNVASGDWSDPNPCPWSLGTEPTSSDSAYITNGGTTNVTQTGETCKNLYIGDANTGTVQMTDGSFSAGWAYIGNTGTGTFTQSAGANIISGGFYLGFNSGANGTYNLSGNGQLQATFEIIGSSGTGIFNQSGGTNRAFADFVIGYESGSSGIYNLTGGTLITPGIGNLDGFGVFNFGGGTVQFTVNSSTYFPIKLTGINGNANIDTAGHVVTLSGTLTGYYGGLNKIGAGTLTLTTINSYDKTTNIINGTLALGTIGTIDSRSVIDVQTEGIFDVSAKNSHGGFSLNSMQTLQGNGNVIGNIVATQGSHIAPGDSAGVLTIAGNLTLNSGALLDYDLANTSASDKISMANSALFLSGQKFSDFTFSPRSDFGIGTYVLIDAGSIQGSLGSNLSGTIGGLSASLSTSGNDLILTVVPEPATIGLLSMGGLIFLGYAWRKKLLRQLMFCLTAMPGLDAGITWADVFNMPAGLTSLEFVTVGNPGNVGELSGIGAGGAGTDRVCGAVNYSYKMGKFEITAGQYTAFLNAVAANDTYGLYNLNMGNQYLSGCNIKRSGSYGHYTYSVATDWANRPVDWVSWDSSARFCNWLTNGQPIGSQNLSTTEDGSYFLNGRSSWTANITRKANASYVIPNEDEWYKAAYYDPNKPGGAGYWDYPTCTNSVPSNILSDLNSQNNANYLYDYHYFRYTIGSPYYRTGVGAFTNSESPYGTFDQGGNVMEWCEEIWTNQAPFYTPVFRGGSYKQESYCLSASYRSYPYGHYDEAGPIGVNEESDIGFRVAYVPEPGSIILLGTGLVGLLTGRLYNRKRYLPGFYW